MRRSSDTATVTTRDVCRITGLTYRQLDYWARMGYVKPGMANIRERDWQESEVRVAKIMARLIEASIEIKKAARIARAVVDTQGERKDVVRVRIAPDISIVIGGRP
jgi:DNA-binding transcriptional MerR regulator